MLIKVVCAVVWQRLVSRTWSNKRLVIRLGKWFSKVHKTYNVSLASICLRTCIGNPNLNSGNVNRRFYQWKVFQPFIISISKKLRKEEVTVRLVFICLHLKLGDLRTALCFYRVAFTLLLRENSSNSQSSKASNRFHSKQVLATRNQRPRKRQRNVTRFNTSKNVVFITRLPLQLHLIFKIECCIGVVVNAKRHSVSNFTRYVKLYALVEIEGGVGLLIVWQCRVINLRNVYPKYEFCRTLRTDFYG